MSFSRAQQPAFRQMVHAAWLAHCRAERIAPGLKPDRAWYEAELEEATGHASTSACSAGRDYDLAMAHFEAITGVSIKWQMRVYSGDAKRMLHELRGLISPKDGVDEDYLREVARNALGLDEPPQLHLIPREGLVEIIQTVLRHLRRKRNREVTAVPVAVSEDPF